MSRLKFALLCFFCVIVSACQQFSPFEDRRREPGTERIWVGSSKPDAPVICYTPFFHNQEKILEQANNICASNHKGSHAELEDINYFSCRLFIPAKARYKCVIDQ